MRRYFIPFYFCSTNGTGYTWGGRKRIAMELKLASLRALKIRARGSRAYTGYIARYKRPCGPFNPLIATRRIHRRQAAERFFKVNHPITAGKTTSHALINHERTGIKQGVNRYRPWNARA